MPALKYSRQRESIKRFLLSRYDHPTADTIYLHVKEEFPNISLGTVYRNLALLTDLGEIIKITTDGAASTDMWRPTLILYAGNAMRSLTSIWTTRPLSMRRPRTYFRESSKGIRYSISGSVRNARRYIRPDAVSSIYYRK